MRKQSIILLLIIGSFIQFIQAQPVMETGGQKMPNEWIDAVTHHKIIKLTQREESSLSFYFHNNPFIDNKMVFYGKDEHKKRQYFIVDLTTFKVTQLTHHAGNITGEILSTIRKEIF